mmetsp:Transcript_123822/g.174582  ORF Transcript_123822/g.174582 Transcript_123822/m.174582 type:complete len:91 (+) Transcript_123822:22-294(+)
MANTHEPNATATMTLTAAGAPEPRAVQLTLRTEEPRRHVQWQENVIDNETLCRKSSKKCCVYHKPKEHYDDSDSESDEEDIAKEHPNAQW